MRISPAGYAGVTAWAACAVTAAVAHEGLRQRRRPSPELLAWSTLAGIIVYIGIDVLLAFLRPGYSLIHNAESDYGRGPWFWVMDANFLLRCALSLAVVAALAQVVPPSARARGGLILLSVWAVCSGLLAFFADDIEGTPQHGSGIVHLVLAFIAFVCVTIATILLSVRLRSEPAWRRAAGLLLPVSLAGLVAFLLLGTATGRVHAPGGLYERIFLGLQLLWIGLAAGFVIAKRPPGGRLTLGADRQGDAGWARAAHARHHPALNPVFPANGRQAGGAGYYHT